MKQMLALLLTLTLLALSSNERAFPHDSPPKSKNSGCNE